MVFSALARELAELEVRALRRRRLTLSSPLGVRVTVEGRKYLAFASNDYLGLAAHPALVEAARAAAARYGVGAGASHLVLGHNEAHDALESALAAFVGMPRALVFSTGYQANLGALSALVGREDAVFADRLNHASLNDAAILSRAALRRYPHCDLEALERLLVRTRARRKLIATDAVFSMDGDIAPLPELIALAERHGAWLLVDDAHGFGVLGREGEGVLGHFGCASPRLVYMATLGKAVGVFGAFVAGPAEVIETLLQRARPYVYTTASPPLLAAAALRALQLLRSEPWRRRRLAQLGARLEERVRLERWRLAPSPTAIHPLLIGASAESVAAAEALAERGLLVPAIRPPTVPEGTARLRISLSAEHSAADVEQLAAALNEVERVVAGAGWRASAPERASGGPRG